jgi:predicted transcriptional regulator
MNPFETLSSETAKLVYLYLREQGAATADELHAALDIPLLKLLPVLRTLEEVSLVAHDGDRYAPAE